MKLSTFFMPWTTTNADSELKITREERATQAAIRRMQNNSAGQNGNLPLLQ